jgi:hypothetical protein
VDDIVQHEELPSFAIFRGKNGISYAEAPVMYAEGVSPVMAEHWPRLQEAGYDAGHNVRLIFSAPGFSLTHVWFKSGFPLPRHSHSADCLYYIVAGTLQIGTEILGAGDGFFLGVDAPYTYTPGENGVEVLEFRTSNHFNIRMLADNPAFWSKAIEQVKSRSTAWETEPPPVAGA